MTDSLDIYFEYIVWLFIALLNFMFKLKMCHWCCVRPSRLKCLYLSLLNFTFILYLERGMTSDLLEEHKYPFT